MVLLGLSERAGHRISFLQFTRYGALVALAHAGLSMPYLWRRYFTRSGPTKEAIDGR